MNEVGDTVIVKCLERKVVIYETFEEECDAEDEFDKVSRRGVLVFCSLTGFEKFVPDAHYYIVNVNGKASRHYCGEHHYGYHINSHIKNCRILLIEKNIIEL